MRDRTKKVSVPELQKLKNSGQKITALTAYDYPFARILDQCGIDFLLVGDSCLLYTSPSPRDGLLSRMPSSA